MADDQDLERPKLEKCIVIDARLRSRKSVVEDLEGYQLFTEVQEAKSLSEALMALSSATFDACVVGSSLSAEGARQLIEDGKKSEASKDCAFIRLVPRSKAESVAASEADAVITVPYSRSHFVHELIKGVVSAKKDSSSSAESLESFGSVTMLEEESPGSVLAQGFQSTETMVAEGTTRLRQLAVPYENGSRRLGSAGRADEEVALEIRLISRHIARHDEKEGEVNFFAIFLEACLHEWFADYVTVGDGEAMANFREKILQFVIDQAG